MNPTRRAILVATAMAVASISACSKQEASETVVLKVSAAGSYEVDGKYVEREALERSLVAAKQGGSVLHIYFQPDNAAPAEAVQYAMTIAQKLGARVGMVQNEVFY